MEKVLKLNSNEESVELYGSMDENLRFAENEYGVKISARNHRLKISGEKKKVELAYKFFTDRLKEYHDNLKFQESGGSEKDDVSSSKNEDFEGSISFFHRNKVIRARTENQEKYLKAIQTYDIVIGIGPAGTGKTYLAMAAAIDALKKKRVSRIVLTRPAVEAGENLGFLPGDLQDKINPYLRPLYDALYDMMDFNDAAKSIERGIIEVAPLAYMRGRTLSDAFVIMDEAQNCTHAQVKMLLTRLGEGSKVIVNGDITQIDLPGSTKSGLVELQTVLAKVPGVAFPVFQEKDVVRHPLVKRVIKAYEKYERDKGIHRQ